MAHKGHEHVHTQARTHEHKHIHTQAHTHEHNCIHTQAHTHVSVYINMWAFIVIHTIMQRHAHCSQREGQGRDDVMVIAVMNVMSSKDSSNFNRERVKEEMM